MGPLAFTLLLASVFLVQAQKPFPEAFHPDAKPLIDKKLFNGKKPKISEDREKLKQLFQSQKPLPKGKKPIKDAKPLIGKKPSNGKTLKMSDEVREKFKEMIAQHKEKEPSGKKPKTSTEGIEKLKQKTAQNKKEEEETGFVKVSGDGIKKCRAEGKGHAVVTFDPSKEGASHYRKHIRPVIISTIKELGSETESHCWFHTDVKDKKFTGGCHQLPCIRLQDYRAPEERGLKNIETYIFGDFAEEQWNVDNIKDFYMAVKAGTAEKVKLGEKRSGEMKFTKYNVIV